MSGHIAQQPAYVYTAPGTQAGRYLRRDWQPVFLSRDLARGRSVPLRVLHEELTLYRGHDGIARVVGARCPHRGAKLHLGFVEGGAIRCMYHGWAFGEGGQCVDQPAEPVPFCHKIKTASYPAEERLGIIFVYMGELPAPPLDLPVPEEWVVETSIVRHPCNYFQRAENNVDGAHVQFVHASAPELGTSIRATPGTPSATEAPFGLTFSIAYPSGIVEENHFLMPNSAYLSLAPGKAPFRIHFRFWYVPIDDEHHNLVSLTFVVEESVRKTWPPLPPASARPDFAKELAAVLDGSKPFDARRFDGAVHPTDVILGQDAVVTCSLGAIADRTQEHLGRTDAGVILLRRIWLRELERLRAGEEPTRFYGLPAGFPRSVEPNDAPRTNSPPTSGPLAQEVSP
jgi:5,5'-dehydrodivanillate O-demethylase